MLPSLPAPPLYTWPGHPGPLHPLTGRIAVVAKPISGCKTAAAHKLGKCSLATLLPMIATHQQARLRRSEPRCVSERDFLGGVRPTPATVYQFARSHGAASLEPKKTLAHASLLGSRGDLREDVQVATDSWDWSRGEGAKPGRGGERQRDGPPGVGRVRLPRRVRRFVTRYAPA